MIYFVSTPIGNLEDISLRALNILKKVDIIACEDTRTSQKLLNHFDIKNKTMSFHKFNEKQSCKKIIELHNNKQDIAIISDAGMPVISDPGNILTRVLRENNLPFTIIPGANAALSALVLSGLDASSFYFLGFLPIKKGEKEKVLREASLINTTLIFYLSPHRLKEDLIDIYNILGKRKCALVKEISKIHEKVYSFTLGDAFVISNSNNENILSDSLIIDNKGEFVLIVDKESDNASSDLSITQHVKFFINLGFSKNDSIKKVAYERNVRKDIIYKEVLKL